ncbi:MAG TPA: IS4 family transposase [Polyangiaceae bacterium]|nr:IS4 family transposase [Polyangiaceae bacterium]
MDASSSTLAWAQETFGHVAFPDRRNVDLAVRVAAGLCERPFAQVSKAFPDEAMRQAVYDLLEHPRCHASALAEAAARATARAAAAYDVALVALDGVSLTLRDPNDRRGTGSVGRRSKGARGLEALDAVASTPGGAVLGLAGLVVWARSHQPNERPSRQRPVHERELGAWLELRARVRQAFALGAPRTRRVLLHDSGADAWPVLLDVLANDGDPNEVSVVRAAQDRCAHAPDRPDEPGYLRALLARAAQRQRRWVWLPAGHGRPARRARLELTTRPVTLTLTLTPRGGRREVTLRAIAVRELGRVPPGQKRLEWVLLTDELARTLKAAWRVVGWYGLRWRVEDQHKAWKKGGGDIEDMRLGHPATMAKWMVWHAAVAARALSLVHHARDPARQGEPAASAFSAHELEALRLVRARYGRTTPTSLTVREAVELLASLGGYNRQAGRRPGPLVVGRGLELIAVVAAALDVQAEEARAGERPKRGKIPKN